MTVHHDSTQGAYIQARFKTYPTTGMYSREAWNDRFEKYQEMKFVLVCSNPSFGDIYNAVRQLVGDHERPLDITYTVTPGIPILYDYEVYPPKEIEPQADKDEAPL